MPDVGAQTRNGTGRHAHREQGPPADQGTHASVKRAKAGRGGAAATSGPQGRRYGERRTATPSRGVRSSRSRRPTARCFRGDTVTLVLSKGPVLVQVPNVVGQQVDQAKADPGGRRLHGAAGRNALGGFFGTVRLQDPGSGKAPKGSTITLTIV